MERKTLIKISQVVSILLTGEKTADEITMMIYKNLGSNHLGFIFSILESQMEANLIEPVFRDKKIYFHLMNHCEQKQDKPINKTTDTTEKNIENKKLQICRTCKKKKPITEYGKCNKYATNIDTQCRECKADYQKTYYENTLKKKRNENKINPLKDPAEKDDVVDAEDIGSMKPPEGTYAYLRWIEKLKEKEFNINDFNKDNKELTMQQVERVIGYQIKQKSIVQLSRDVFRLVK